jgi:hypothetical protein
MTGNSFTNWAKLPPRHNAFIQEILQSPVHIIATIRSKQDYVLIEKNGKVVPEKIGLKGKSREGFDYELTMLLELDIKHNTTATKDRTSLFIDKPEFKITTETGRKILDWCIKGKDVTIEERINDCKSLKELLQLYQASPQHQQQYQEAFVQRREALQTRNNIVNPKPSLNGSPTSN